jgi:hypothetical protein
MESIVGEIKIGEIDYAILKCISYGYVKIQDLNNILEIRTIILEKHIYEIIKDNLLNVQNEEFVITDKGNEAINYYETNKPENIWKPIDDFIISSIRTRKEQRIKFYKTLNLIMAISIVILIIIILYILFGLI